MFSRGHKGQTNCQTFRRPIVEFPTVLLFFELLLLAAVVELLFIILFIYFELLSFLISFMLCLSSSSILRDIYVVPKLIPDGQR